MLRSFVFSICGLIVAWLLGFVASFGLGETDKAGRLLLAFFFAGHGAVAGAVIGATGEMTILFKRIESQILDRSAESSPGRVKETLASATVDTHLKILKGPSTTGEN
jgi:hypothetical protein